MGALIHTYRAAPRGATSESLYTRKWGAETRVSTPLSLLGGSCAALVRWGLMGRPCSDGCSLVKSVAVVEQTVNQVWLLTGDWQVSGSEQFLELGNRFLGLG